MNLNLKGRNGCFLTIFSVKKLQLKIDFLKKIHKKNPTKNALEKFTSLLVSETFFNMMIEGEVSSKREIIRDFAPRKKVQTLTNSYKDFYSAYLFILEQREFSVSNLFTLYSIISDNRIDDKNKLAEGKMFRDGDVYIGTRKLGKSYQGLDAKTIGEALLNLFRFLKNPKYDLYLRAIVGHIYFEMIHPFYDFNGRTGRFIPLWLFINEGRGNEMMYFATAMGHFRDQYLAIFNEININTYEMSLDKMVSRVLDLLIINQEQYIWIKQIENRFLDQTKKHFSNIQKNLIWKLMIKSEISNYEGSWFKLTKNDKAFIELKMTPSSFSNALRDLREHKVISVSETSPRNYKLLNYKLFGLKK